MRRFLQDRKVALTFCAILLVGALFRFYRLGYALLFIDELSVLGIASAFRSPGEIVDAIVKAGFKGFSGQHMPLQYCLANVSMRLFQTLGLCQFPCLQDPPAALMRFPFAVLGFLTLPFVYRMASLAYGRKTGLWTMALVSTSFFHVYQSRDATSYVPLLFFLAVHFCGLAGLVLAEGPPASLSRKAGYGALFVFGAAGALFTHMTAWLLLAPEGAVLAFTWLVRGRRRARTDESKASAARVAWLPAVLLLVTAFPFLMFVVPNLGAFKQSTTLGSGESLSVVTRSVLYAIPHFGWGKGNGRLTIFLVVLIAGTLCGILKPSWRGRTLLCLAGFVLPLVGFWATNHYMFPRYASASFLPMMVLTGLGLSEICERAAKWSRLQAAKGAVAAGVIGCLVAWHVGPYRALFTMHNKLRPFSQIREWIMRNVPEGGLFVWQDGYNLREIPHAYPVGGRQGVFAEYWDARAPIEWRAQNARSFFERFPTAPLLVESCLTNTAWKWVETSFSNRATIPADAGYTPFWRWGFSPHGSAYYSRDFTAYYNTESNAMEKLASSSEAAAWPVGGGWRYVQTQDGQLFAAPAGKAELTVVRNQATNAASMLVMRVAALESGAVAAQLSQGAASGPSRRANFVKSNGSEIRLGPFDLTNRQSRLTLAQYPDDKLRLLIHDVRLAPVAAP